MGRKEVTEWSKIINKCGVYSEDECLWLANAIAAAIDKARQERTREIIEFIKRQYDLPDNHDLIKRLEKEFGG